MKKVKVIRKIKIEIQLNHLGRNFYQELISIYIYMMQKIYI